MQTKLTLRLDDRLIEKAKAWAKSRGISLSQAVSELFAQLPEWGESTELTAWTNRLVGAAATRPGRAPTDEEVMPEYVDYLDAKYR